MLDYGDLNPSESPSHYVSMIAYVVNNSVVSVAELAFLSSGGISPQYGNLALSGDAVSAQPGQPGNWTWNVHGAGIVRVVLDFGDGHDPNIAFDSLSFTTECPPACQPAAVTADFSNVAAGQSVEGLGVVAPNLNIDAIGTAVKILPATPPYVYSATGSGTPVLNGWLVPSGGFSDPSTRMANQAQRYTFTFSPGISVSNFSLHMLDFGDLNPTLVTNHYVSLTAYDINGIVAAKQELSYTSSPELAPTSSNLYGNLIITGDAASAVAGQPGNWTWNISGTGIVRVVLDFGVGFDPAIGFDSLSFTTECP
jgi:hypothetical protein